MTKQIDKAAAAAMVAGGAVAGLVIAAPFLLVEYMLKKQRDVKKEMALKVAEREAEKRRSVTDKSGGFGP